MPLVQYTTFFTDNLNMGTVSTPPNWSANNAKLEWVKMPQQITTLEFNMIQDSVI